MIVTSGIIPYQYVGRYPLVAASPEEIGFSGILFEQAMTVLTAETLRYLGDYGPDGPQFFNKYIHPSFSPFEFTPMPDGSNLNGYADNVPAAAAFVDYLVEMRDALDNLFLLMAFDGGTVGAIKTDWLMWCGNPSGTFPRDYARPAISPVGIITSADATNDLGASGILYDIDLREVSFQPFTRMAEGIGVDYKHSIVAISPVFPNFQTTGGVLVNANTRDAQVTLGISNIDRDLGDVNNNRVILDGDMFFDPGTNFVLIPGTAARQNLEGQVINNAFTIHSLPGRVLQSNTLNIIDPRTSALLIPTARAEGGYAIGAIDNPGILTKLVVPSGTSSFHPNINFDGQPIGSGYYVFDDSFWILDPIARPSGLNLMNGLNGELIWFRLADQTSASDQAGRSHSFSTTVGLIKNGGSVFRLQTTGDATSLLNDVRMGFFEFDLSNLDFATFNNPSQPWTTFKPGALNDACFDGTNFMIHTNSNIGLGRNIYIFDSGGNFTDAKLYSSNPIFWIQNGLFGGRVMIAINNGSLYELEVDPDPSVVNVNDTGINYTVDTTAPAWPSEAGSIGVSVHDAQIVSGSSTITPGDWFIAQTGGTADKVVIFRATIDDGAAKIVPQEAFIIPNLDPLPGSLRWQFVHGNFT